MTHKSYSSGFGSVPNSTPKDNDPMVRIADALEEILRLVKADQEKYTAREAREMLQTDELSKEWKV
jgi:hypothetical protein